jgi:hypothetical protein
MTTERISSTDHGTKPRAVEFSDGWMLILIILYCHCQVVNHGISKSCMKGALEAASEFFELYTEHK